MKAEALLALYERVADAPDATARLRRFVLDLAVRGKLVDQDATDEPASELLNRVAEELSVLAKAKEIRQPKPLSEIDEESLPYELPSGWAWTQIGRLGVVSPRVEADDSLPASFVPMTLIPAEYGAGNAHEVRPWGEIKKGYTHLAEGDVALAKITPCFENGKSVVFRNLTGGIGAGTTELHVLRPLIVNADYVVLFLKSPQFIETGIPRMTGTAGQKRVPTEYFTSSPFPLPPLAEQHRIVAKVDELMALLDRLEAARSAREATRDRLTTASLTRLTAADTDPEALRSHARFALDALPALTTRADQIKQLRQTILDLAVRGRLVGQDSADEPATNLLLRIEAQRSALGLTSRQAPPRESEAPFRLPCGWRIARLGDLCSKTGSGSTPRGGKEVYRSSGVAFLRSQNVHNDGIRLDDVAYIDGQTHQRMSGTQVLPGDLLLNITGGSIGRCARVPHDFCDANLSQHVAIVRPAEPGIQRFLHWLILSPFFQGFVMDEQTGAGRGGLPKNRMDRILVPLPPLAEQHRIVAKVDALMALCDRLEVALQSADSTRARLLEALLHEALNAPADNVIDFAEAGARLRARRSAIGALIVQHQARHDKGGRIKVVKSLYLAEAHCGLALGGRFGRADFGPHDQWIYVFEREAGAAGWFTFSERPLGNGNHRVEYAPGPALAAKAEEARAGLGGEAAELERILDLLARLTAEEAEIAATLFAAWNDQLIDGEAVSDDVVITEVREHWHPSKARFTPEVLKKWLGWLRHNGLVPRGRGPSTRQQGRLI